MKVIKNRYYTGSALDETTPTAAETAADRFVWFVIGAAFLYFFTGVIQELVK